MQATRVPLKDAKLEELVRQTERLLDAQRDSAQLQDNKTAHLLTTASALLAAIGFATSLTPASPADRHLMAYGLAAGLVCNAVAFLLLMRAYTGSLDYRKDLAIGWDTRNLQQATRRDFSIRHV